MRVTINIKSTEDLQRVLRSAAAKLNTEDIIPGADIEIGDVRIRVAESQISEIREFAHKFEFPVGKRGRFSDILKEAWELYSTSENKRKTVHTVRRMAAEARAAQVPVGV